jgi:hypothetical protein
VQPGAPEIVTPAEVSGTPAAPEISSFGAFRKKLGKIKKEVREAESALHKAFESLKDDIREQVRILEKTRTKRQLTEEEERVVKQLKKDLDDAEKFVRKEIEDIKKEAK